MPTRLEDGRIEARNVRRRRHFVLRQECAWDGRLCHRESTRSGARGAGYVRLVARVAGRGDRQDADLGRAFDGSGQVVVKRLAVGEPSDMLTMSTRSVVLPSPFGSAAYSMPCSRATPLHEVETALQILTANRSTCGATPVVPPMMSATCVPWPPPQPLPGASPLVPQSIGSSSGARSPFGHTSPTKS